MEDERSESSASDDGREASATDEGGEGVGAGDDRDWPDPPLSSDRDVGRLRVRLAVSALVFLAFLALSGERVFEVVGMLWPPHESLSRWFTLVLLQLMGYVVLPLLVGGLIGDAIYDRYIDR